MASDDDDDWAFKLDNGETSKTEKLVMDDSIFDDTNTSVRNLKAKLSRTGAKTNKKTKHKPLIVDNQNRVVKKSRRAVAREMATPTKSAIYTQNYPTRAERVLAGLLDLALVAFFIFGSHFIAPFLNEILDDFLLVLASIEEVEPELIAKYSWIVLASFLTLIFYTIPSILYRKSLGKSIFSLYIGNENKVAREAGIVQAFIRELIFKPISVISVFGILMIFVNRNKRSLHDRLSGTSVLKS